MLVVLHCEFSIKNDDFSASRCGGIKIENYNQPNKMVKFENTDIFVFS